MAEADHAAPRRTLQADDGRLARGRRSRARIRAAARTLFRERGFDGATLRAIGAAAGMGASSIYRHYRSKEELLVEELGELQEQGWTTLRKEARTGDRAQETARERVRNFLDHQQEYLAADPDFTKIALRATTHPEAPVAKRVLALHDRTVGLLTEILMAGRARREFARDADLLAAAQAIFHVTTGARIAWVNDQLSTEACRRSIDAAVELVFRGLSASE